MLVSVGISRAHTQPAAAWVRQSLGWGGRSQVLGPQTRVAGEAVFSPHACPVAGVGVLTASLCQSRSLSRGSGFPQTGHAGVEEWERPAARAGETAATG